MKHLLTLGSLVFLAVSGVMWWLPNPWSLADAKAANDARLLIDLAERPDRLRMRLAEDTSLKNAVVWNADGVLQHPAPEKFNHVLFELSENEIRRLARIRQQASPIRWAQLDSGSRTLVRCSRRPSLCLVYDLNALQEAVGVGRNSLAIPDRRNWWIVLSVLMAAVFGLAAFWPHRMTKAGPPKFSLLPERHAAKWDGREVLLTPRDLKLLTLLKERGGAVVTKDELYDAGWGRAYMPNSRALDQHIINLRRKLDPNRSSPDLIETVHGVGYRLSE